MLIKERCMGREKLLVVDDEEDIRVLLKFNLAREGYQVTCADSGEEALPLAKTATPDLILLDLMLPGIDGIDVAKQLKRDPGTRHIPIIMLTAKSEEKDILTGLEIGADDYVTKPFSARILLARIRAALRNLKMHSKDEDPSVIRIQDLIIHKGHRTVHLGEEPIPLTLVEFEILYALAKQPGWVKTRSQIIDAVHGEDYSVSDRSVDVQIVGLRKKLGNGGRYIETVRGLGYRLKE
jgi:two-component system phosphate regulon response regulator PhoB